MCLHSEPTDQKMTSIVKRVYFTPRFPQEGVCTNEGHVGVRRLRWKGRGDERKMWTRNYLGISMGQNRQGRVGSLGIG